MFYVFLRLVDAINLNHIKKFGNHVLIQTIKWIYRKPE